MHGLQDSPFRDITVSDLQLLHHVRSPSTVVAEIVAATGLTKQAVGKAVKSLVKRGYMVQEASIEDARVKLLVLTEKGARLAKTGRSIVERMEQRFARELGKAGLASMKRRLRQLAPESQNRRRP